MSLTTTAFKFIGLNRAVVGAILGGYIILYGQVQSWTPQLVTGPLNRREFLRELLIDF